PLTPVHRQVNAERSLWFALPFFAVALARGANRSLRAGAALALAGWVVVLTAGSYVACLERPTAWTVYKHNPDWQAAARYLAEQSFNPDPLVVFAVVPIDDLRFYVRRDVRGRHAKVMTYSEAALDDALSGRGSGPLYLVNNLYWPGDFDRVLERFLRDGRLTQIDARTFAGVTLYAFRPASVNDPERPRAYVNSSVASVAFMPGRYLFAARIWDTKPFTDLVSASMTAEACAAGEPPANPPSCRSCTGTATRPFRYGNVASACETSDAS